MTTFLRLSLSTFLITCAAALVPTPAVAEEDCAGYAILAMQPADAQTDVPVDVLPRVLFEWRDDCGWSDTAPLKLLRDGQEVSAKLEEVQDAFSKVRQLVPDAPLMPDTMYKLRLEGEDGVEVWFRTGSRTTAALAGPPSIEVLSAVEDAEQELLHHVTVRVTPAAADADRLSFVRVLSGEDAHAMFVVGPADPVEVELQHYGPKGADVCISASQTSANGTEHVSEPACVSPTAAPDAGCSAAGSAPGKGVPMMLVLGAIVALRSARRRGRKA